MRLAASLILSKEKPLTSETVFLKMSTAGWGDRYCHICEFTNFCVAVVHLDTARESSGVDEVQASNAVAIATIRAAFEKYGAEWKPLVGRVIPNAPSFPLATTGSAVSGVRFTGDGVFTSLLGEYENAMSGFHVIIR